MADSYRVGLFPSALDSLYMEPFPSGVEVYYLVVAESKEETWARKFLPAERIAPYRLSGTDISLVTADLDVLIQYSDLTEVIRELGLDALLYTDRLLPPLYAWANQLGIRVISPSFEFQQQFENKAWFYRFLLEHEFEQPRGLLLKHPSELTIGTGEKYVAQIPVSRGGEGTFFVTSDVSFRRLFDEGVLKEGEETLVREFVKGEVFGITCFVGPGVVALSSLCNQCFYPTEEGGSLLFAGVQFVPSSRLPSSLTKKLNDVFQKLGKLMHEKGYLGFINFDFIATSDDRVILIESNARFTGASAHLLHFPELLSGFWPGQFFSESFLQKTPYPKKAKVQQMPSSDFEGALLFTYVYSSSVNEPMIVQETFESGVYDYHNGQPVFVGPDIRLFHELPDRFVFYTDAVKGDLFHDKTLVGSILASFPVYDEKGMLNDAGKLLVEYFAMD